MLVAQIYLPDWRLLLSERFILKLLKLRLDEKTFYRTCVCELLSPAPCKWLSYNLHLKILKYGLQECFPPSTFLFSYYHHRPRSRKKEETGPIMCYCIIYKFHAHVKDRNRAKFIIFVPTFQNYSHLYDSVIVSSIKLLEYFAPYIPDQFPLSRAQLKSDIWKRPLIDCMVSQQQRQTT